MEVGVEGCEGGLVGGFGVGGEGCLGGVEGWRGGGDLGGKVRALCTSTRRVD